MTIRHATLDDISSIYPLIRIIWEDMSHPLLTLLDDATFKHTMCDLMRRDESKFSYRNALVYEINHQVVGVLYGYDGHKEPAYDKQLIDYIRKRFPNVDTTPLHMERESCDDEWYLDSLVVAPQHRSQGIAKAFFNYLHANASQSIIGLNCEYGNDNAFALYQKMGYKNVYSTTFLGHTYRHMQRTSVSFN
ncbi:GNAT family N-acetyltransferase [Carnobacteriaceae bacterium zg-ZUI252]|nr:GNAT family N-acetyltransferase [Carnobacteriaceae bacterium zg-ZUI252]MBS4770471.1 GNAT family N-acetyltransferase [Carnobacteriaceae bacterium zg-ZUI240]